MEGEILNRILAPARLRLLKRDTMREGQFVVMATNGDGASRFVVEWNAILPSSSHYFERGTFFIIFQNTKPDKQQ